jgi:hypothetical protein
MVSGGANGGPQYSPTNVSATGGAGQSGNFTGFTYGMNKAINESRVQGNQAVASIKSNAPAGIAPEPIPAPTPLTAETMNPEQSILDGAPIGDGAMSIPNLPKNPSGDPDIDMIRDYYPILNWWASQPGAAQGTKDYVRYLGTII